MNTKHPTFIDVAAMLTAGVAGIAYVAVSDKEGAWLAMILIALVTLLTVSMTITKKLIIIHKTEPPNPNEP